MRRIFGTTPGPVLQASPSSWEGRPVTADADAFSLSVTPYGLAQVAMRIAAANGSVLGGRLLSNSLPASYATTAGTLTGPQLADGGGQTGAASGPPDVAVAEDRSRGAVARLGFLAGSQLRQMGTASGGGLVPIPTPLGPPAVPESEPVAAVDPEGGGLVAYPALDGNGLPAVAVRQESRTGAAQTGLVSGSEGGPVAELTIGRSGSGDGLIAFRQGEPGRFQIVTERVGAPPRSFRLDVPKRWLKPNAVKLRWQAAASAVGSLRYAVLVNGRTIEGKLRRRVFHPRPAQLGNGVLRVQVLATDGLGQGLLSSARKLRVDGQRPTVKVHVRAGRTVAVRLQDGGSGLQAKASVVHFGDGALGRRGSRFAHAYDHGGRYTVVVRGRDRVGNRTWRRFEVRVP
jgi:hypothetical protein